ncbi:UNVERIFIED_CONTAM: Mannose-1-phosphate guanyltransferase alpha [Sesamum radiatum]|uniref:Mannose-1-phosphate guanyltransferase alpha n=1 Tax=Sesamum radiatum TaxID=300843 RepID=A0AAW2RYU3_SESRA
MGGVEERVVAVIMVGGPTKGTRFRPLSLNIPKPLFPLAGQPMVNHPISAFFPSCNLCFRYLREDRPHGSAGGLYNFRDLIMEDNPVRSLFYSHAKLFSNCILSHIVLLNCDVCCSFPLPDMLEAHRSYGGIGTILVIKVSPESANQFGEIVADPVTNELLHYTEKPETFVSDRINCGVYIFTPDIFTAIQGVSTQRKDRAMLRRVTSFEALQPADRSLPSDFVRLDQDILSPLAGKRQLYVYETMDLGTNQNSRFRLSSPHLLASGDGTKKATVTGNVYIHPSTKVHPTAKIGPNVSISANARIGAGSRLVNCIILDDVEGLRRSQRQAWGYNSRYSLHSFFFVCRSFLPPFSALEQLQLTHIHISEPGESVTVEDEVVVINSIILPNKTLNVSVQEEIIL